MKNRWTVARRLKKRRRQNQLKRTWENVKENKTSSWSKAQAEVKVRVVQNLGKEAKVILHQLCVTQAPRAAGEWDLFTASWFCHIHGIPWKCPWSRASPAPSGHCAPGSSSTTLQGSSPQGWWLPPQSNSIHQLIQGIPVENTLLYNSQEKKGNTNSFQVLDSMVESTLQGIPWLYDTFLLSLCYSPTLKITPRRGIILGISEIYYYCFPTSLSDLGPLLSEATHAELCSSITGAFQAKNNVELMSKNWGRKGSATSNFTSSSWGLTGFLHV